MFIISLTVHRKTNFLVNLYWDNKYSDSDSEGCTITELMQFKKAGKIKHIIPTVLLGLHEEVVLCDCASK